MHYDIDILKLHGGITGFAEIPQQPMLNPCGNRKNSTPGSQYPGIGLTCQTLYQSSAHETAGPGNQHTYRTQENDLYASASMTTRRTTEARPQAQSGNCRGVKPQEFNAPAPTVG
jgi:hypothetical protein